METMGPLAPVVVVVVVVIAFLVAALFLVALVVIVSLGVARLLASSDSVDRAKRLASEAEDAW